MCKKKNKTFWLSIIVLIIYCLYAVFANSIVLSFYSGSKIQKGNISQFIGGDSGTMHVDNLEYMGGQMEEIYIAGWAFCDTSEPNDDKRISLILQKKGSEDCFYLENDTTYERKDVYDRFSSTRDIQGIFHGYRWQFSTVNLKNGDYRILVHVKENESTSCLLESQYTLTKQGRSVELVDRVASVDSVLNGTWHASQVAASGIKREKVNVSVVDSVTVSNQNIVMRGWSVVGNSDSALQQVYIQLRNESGEVLQYETKKENREDVAEAFKDPMYMNSGFVTAIPSEELEDGFWNIYVLVEQENGVYVSNPYGLKKEGATVERIESLASIDAMIERGKPAEEPGVLVRILSIPLNALMRICYNITDNYIAAIIVFTFLSKIILLPISLWMQRNSIKMVEMMPALNQLKIKYFGDKETISEETQILYKEKGYQPLLSTLPMIIQIVMLMGVIEAVKALLGDSDSWLLLIPSEVGGVTLLMPLAAGFAAFMLCLAQNKIAPLQKEQHKAEKLSTGMVSVSISLFLGAYVSLGTGVYWIASNLISIPMQMVCNLLVNPKKYVDYEALEASRKQLAELEGIGKKKKESYFSENKRRERADYKRFFSIVNKHLVFYSESNGFYKYFKGFIEFILEHSNIIIHYITSDPNDQIFELEKENPRIKAYYIGENKLITLMMKIEADVVVMTMPDLENYHIKRSYIRKDIEYIYVQHGMGSNNMCLRTGCVDHFDTVFCSGIHQKEEVEQTEQVYGLPKKTCVELGYPMIDEMRAAYAATEHKPNERKKVLIAPSWQKDNIIDSCLEQLLDSLKNTDYEIIVRPHPQEVRLKSDYMNVLKQKYEPAGIEIQTDFSSNNPIMEADILITDWSGISWEYAFTTLRPILYINTPMRVMNPEYQKIETVPLNILLRDKLGKSLNLDQLDKTAETVEYLLDRTEEYREEIEKLAHQYIYNLGHSSEVGAKYIIRRIQKKASERSKK